MAVIPNPVVPYIGRLNGASPGLLLNIAGTPMPTAKWFAINMQCGPNMNPRDDIALHINPRFDGPTSKIIRNSLANQAWGMEESFGHFPLVPGQPFEILVLAEDDMFKIAINGEHYSDFQHRMPLMRVNTLTIDGDVQIHSIRFEGGDAGIPPEVQQSSAGQLGTMPMPTGRSPSPQPHGAMGMPMPGAGEYGGQTHGAMPMQQQHMPAQTGAPYGTSGQQYPETVQHMGDQNMTPGTKQALKYGAVGIGGALAGAALSRLVYPGHKGKKHGGGHGGMMGGMGQMIPGMGGHGHKKDKKMKKMMKSGHKPKKFKNKHKGGKKSSGSSSSSSSSSSE